jgi:anti-sigma B factor antagonist
VNKQNLRADRMEEITIKDSLRITPMQVGGDGETIQLVLNGYLDTYNSPEFQSHINELINSGVKNILFNLGGLNYISSTGIGAFTSFLKNLRQRKGNMVLFDLQEKVMEVFQLLGFTKFFKIASDLDEALLFLRGGTNASGGQTEKFPLTFDCPFCKRKLKTGRSGTFRCTGCKGTISVDDLGAVTGVSEGE